MTRQVVGLHSCKEVLKVRPQAVRVVYVVPDFEKDHDLKNLAESARKRGLKVEKRDEAFLRKIAASHQGVCIEVSSSPTLDLEEISDDPNEPMVLVGLDEVTDPQNVGAVLRTAWLSGAKGVLVTERRSAHLTPAVCKVASGGAEHVPVVISTNMGSDLSLLKQKGFWIFGLAGGAESKSIFTMDLPPRILWLTGSEERGLRTSTRKLCDELVAIPQVDAEASYNASVATGMALFESSRQARKHKLNS